MATQNIKIGLEVSDNGTGAKQIKTAEQIRKAYEDAASAAAKVGGTSGSRKAAAAAYSPSTGTAMSEQTYSNLRGSAGVTGASARDFANQAQGLGGLVRLYATYAANIFAVGAAFRALSSAMDTTNMVRGLDQLGAASGVALGSLSKRLVQATDGALSLRESMEAVAKASSSGMSSKQILDMGNVAKKASQALGIDMADAMSRITRAATKLEPELVDELGLFTKTGKAAEDYAKSVGKSVSELTDFERRMSYSNALIAEGKAKFDAIEIDTNPYTKLSAAVKDLAQSGLELVNNVLAPIAKYLATSPGALTAAISLLGITLIKQAVPAFGEFKNSLAAAADQANKLSIQKAADAEKAKETLAIATIKRMEQLADDKVAAVDAAEKKIANLQKAGLKETSRAFKLLQTDILDVTDKQIRGVEEAAKKLKDTNLAGLYREVAKAVREHKDAEESLRDTKVKLSAQVKKDAESWNTYGQVVRAANNAQNAAIKSQIISNAAYNGSLIGITGSIALMKDELEKSGGSLSKLEKAGVLTRGTISALGGQLSTLAATLGNVGMIVGAAIGVWEIFTSIFSKASKEIANFSESAKNAEAAVSNLNRVTDRLAKKENFLLGFTEASVKAQSAAILELSDSLDTLISKGIEAQKAILGGNFFADIIPQAVLSVLGKDVWSVFTKNAIAEISSLGKAIERLPEPEKNLGRLYKILGISNISEIPEAIQKLAPSSSKFKELQKLSKDVGVELGNISSGMEKISATSKKAIESGKALLDSYKVKTPVADFARDSLIAIQALQSGISSGGILTSIEALARVSQTISDTPIYGMEASLYLGKYAKDIDAVNTRLKEQAQQLVTINKRRDENLAKRKSLEDELASLETKGVERNLAEKTIKTKITELDLLIKVDDDSFTKLQSQYNTNKSEAYKFISEAKVLLAKGTSDSINKTVESIRLELAKGSTEFMQSVYSKFADSNPEASRRLTDLKLQEISIAQKQILLQAETNKQLNLLSARLAVESAQRGLDSAKEDMARKGSTAFEIETWFKNAPETRLLNQRKDEQRLIEASYGKRPTAGLEEAQQMLAKDGKALSSEFVDRLKNLSEGTAGVLSQINKLGQQKSIINLEGRVKEIQSTAKQTMEARGLGLDKDFGASIIKYKKEYEELNKLASTATYDILIQTAEAEKRYNLEKSRLDYENAITKAISDREATEILISAITDKSIAGTERAKAIAVERNAIEEAKRKQIEDTNKVNEASAKKLANIEFERFTTAQRLINLKQRIASSTTDTELKLTAESLALQEKQGILSGETLETAKYEQQVAESTFAFNQSKFTAEQEHLTTVATLKKQIAEAGKDTEAGRALDAELKLEQQRYPAALAGETALYNAKLKTLSVTKDLNIEEIKFKETLDTLKGLDVIFAGLGNSLEGFGSKLADVASSFRDFSKDQEANAAKLIDIEKRKQDIYDSGDTLGPAIIKEESDARKKAQKDELTGIAKVAGATKKMFGEKTVAYKALSGLEKAMHIAKLGMMAVELSATITNTTAEVGAETTKMAPKGVNAILSALSAPFPTNFVAGAAMAAIVASLVSGFSSPSIGTVPTGITAEMRQETQGTAMSYDSSGDKVQIRRGVFGDTDAKSESIANSLEILKDNSVEGLSYDNKMLNALNKVADSLASAAKSIYRIPGIASGSMTGTREGTNSSGGLLGISGLFNTTTTQEIIDSGIRISGTFYDIAKAGNSVIEGFETIKTTEVDSGFFGIFGEDTSTSVDTLPFELPETAKQAIRKAFSYGADLLIEIGKLANISEDTVLTALRNVPVNELASLRGLTGEEFSKQLSNVIGSVFDDAAFAVFSSFDKYANFGEGMLETVIRVLDTNTKISQALTNMRVLIDSTGNYDITEALAKGAGGLSNFLEQATFFTDNFLTEEERLATKQQTLTRTFNDLNIAIPTSREAFKELVQGLDLTTVAGRQTYQVLMDVAPTFADVTKEIDKALAGSETRLKQIYENRKKELSDLISGWQKVNETLTSFIKDLKLGSDSILSPREKFALAKEEYNKALAAIKDPSTDPKERLKYAQQFTELSKTLLSTGKTLYASSEGYTSLYDTILSDSSYIESQSAALSTGFQNELDALDTLARQLGIIEEKTTDSTDFLGEIKTYLTTKFGTDIYDQVISAYSRYENRSGFGTSNTNVDIPGAIYWMQRAKDTSSTNIAADMYAGPRREFVTDLYKSFGINTPDEAGVNYWMDQASSLGVDNIIKPFKDSLDSWLEDTTNTEAKSVAKYIVEGAYSKIFGRIGDEGGIQYWIQKLLERNALNLNDFENTFRVAGIAAGEIPKYAVGGTASTGWAIVGEEGPELVNFSNPGRVYTAEDTANLMKPRSSSNNNYDLVIELQNLREEIVQLRKDQEKQTGAIISSNYDANFKAADKVGSSISDSAKAEEWDAKNKYSFK